MTSHAESPFAYDPAAMLRTAVGSQPAAPWPAPNIADLATAFPELAIDELVGQGGMAAVYRATQRRLGRPVALKVMRPDLAAQPQFNERFVREARALAALANPHVLTIHDFGERAGFCYLVTEFVDGANLRELMQMGRLSAHEVLRIVPQICAGLHFAHQHGIVHRDIKPENVLIDRQGQVKLADFGLAKLAGEAGQQAFTQSGQVFGTPHYMAPEQWHGSALVDHRADIYSLGVVLYELLTGRLPVGTFAPASQQPGVPPGIDQVVQRSLQHEPERRYQSASEVQRELERQQSHPATAATTSPPNPAPRPRAAGGLLVAAIALLVVGLSTVVALAVHDRHLAWEIEDAMTHDADNLRAVEAIRVAVARGEPWLGTLPDPVTAPTAGPFDGLGFALVFGGSALAVITIAWVLAYVAWRRTRQAGTSRIQHTVAGVLLVAPAYAIAAAGLGVWADVVCTDGDGIPLVVVFTILAGAGWIVRLAWRASADRPAAPPLGVGPGVKAASAIVIVAGIALGAAAADVQRKPAWKPQARLPIVPAQLVGRSRTDVLECLGPPLSIQSATAMMSWSYRGLDGRQHAEAVVFANGIVVRAEPSATRLVPEPMPAHGRCIGKTVQELVHAIGTPKEVTQSLGSSRLEFYDGTIATADASGMVIQLAN